MPNTANAPCPHLPPPRVGLDWRALHQHRRSARGAAFYVACLEYGSTLWHRGLPARALLCLDRAFGAELTGTEPVLREQPLPYAAVAWILTHTGPDVFLGNPRVHFQHYADRLRGPRLEVRRARAWACWALVRATRPEFDRDPRHLVREPRVEEIAEWLGRHGHAGEVGLWTGELDKVYGPDETLNPAAG